MPTPANTTEERTPASRAHQVSALQAVGCIAPESNDATAPPGDHRAMVSNVVPKIVECAKRPSATSGRKLSRPTALTVSTDLTRPTKACPTPRKTAELKITARRG